MYDHSRENYWAELSNSAIYYAIQGGSNFQSVDESDESVTIQLKTFDVL